MSSFKDILQSGNMLLGMVFLAGFFTLGFTQNNVSPGLVAYFQFFCVTVPLAILIFGNNNVWDYESDRQNPRKNRGLLGDVLDKKHHAFVNRLSFASAILLLASSLLTLNLQNLFLMACIVFLSYFYSAEPIRLKTKPPLDSLSNGLGFLLLFLIGYSYGSSIFTVPLKWVAYSFCICGFHSFSTALDYGPDKKAGHNTFAVRFGKRAAVAFALFMVIPTFLLFDMSLATRITMAFWAACLIAVLARPTDKVFRAVFLLICSSVVLLYLFLSLF